MLLGCRIPITQCHNLADLLVTPLERQEYMYELRNIAENIVRERCEYSEVQPAVEIEHECEESVPECAESVPQCAESVPQDAKTVGVQHAVPENVGNAAEPLGPAFHIPMTQGKTLEDLPSQMDFDWQDTDAAPIGMAVPPKDPEESLFLEVQQIADEAVVHATQQQAERETDQPTTTTKD
jgi:hypothetical protein